MSDESTHEEMTVSEARQLSEQRTAETHTHEFYEDIGRKGEEEVQRPVKEQKESEQK